MRTVKTLLAVLVLFFVGRVLVSNFRSIDWEGVHLNPVLLAAALVLFLVQVGLIGVGFHFILRAFDAPVEPTHSLAINWVASLGKYIPGKLGAWLGGAYLLVRAGVAGPLALGVAFVPTALMVLVDLIVAAPLLMTETGRTFVPVGWVPTTLIIVTAAVCLHPRVFIGLTNLGLRRLGREPIHARPSTVKLLTAMGVLAFRDLVLAAAVWCVIRSFSPPGETVPGFGLLLTGAVAAQVVGFLAVFSPAGIGVREGVYLLVLGPVLGSSAALLAVLVRTLQTLADVLMGLLGLGLLKPSPGKLPDGDEPTR